MNGYVSNIEKDTLENDNFRKVIYTAPFSQLVIMTLKPGEEIGAETHNDRDQFFRVEAGQGVAVLNNISHNIEDGSAIVIPAGTPHNIINTSETEKLKVYTIYSPAEHKDGTIHQTKAEAMAHEEHFDGKTTE